MFTFRTRVHYHLSLPCAHSCTSWPSVFLFSELVIAADSRCVQRTLFVLVLDVFKCFFSFVLYCAIAAAFLLFAWFSHLLLHFVLSEIVVMPLLSSFFLNCIRLLFLV